MSFASFRNHLRWYDSPARVTVCNRPSDIGGYYNMRKLDMRFKSTTQSNRRLRARLEPCATVAPQTSSPNDPDSPVRDETELEAVDRTTPSHPSLPHPTNRPPHQLAVFHAHAAPAHDGVPRRLHHPGDPVENRFRRSSIQKKPPRPTHNVLTTRNATRRAVDHGGLATRATRSTAPAPSWRPERDASRSPPRPARDIPGRRSDSRWPR